MNDTIAALTLKADAEAKPNRPGFLGWLIKNRVSALLVLIGLLFSSAVTILHEDGISPVDELAYLDYALQVDNVGIVKQGDQYGEEVAHLLGCNQLIPHGTFGQKCDPQVTPNIDIMPDHGFTSVYAYTPVYFWATRIVGDPIHAITGLSQTTSWRLTGGLWLAGGLIVMVQLFRRWKVSETATFGLGLAFIVSPFSWWTYSYLSTDVSLFLFGAAALLIATDVIKGRQRGWWLIPLGLASVLFKITNLLAIALALLVIIIGYVARRVEDRRNRADHRSSGDTVRVAWLPAAVAVTLAAGAQLAWMKVFPLLGTQTNTIDQGVNSELTFNELLRLAMTGPHGPILHNAFDQVLPNSPFLMLSTPLGWLLIAGVFGSMMLLKWDAAHGPLVVSVGLASVLILPALGLLMYLTSGSYFLLPGRYAAAMIPGYLLLTGLILRNRGMQWAVIVYAVVLGGAGLISAALVGAHY